MKRLIAVLLVIVSSFLFCGCGVFRVVTNLPIWSVTASRTVIVNNTADYRFIVLLNGRISNQYMVMPGQDYSCDARNFDESKTKEFCIVVKAYDSSDNMVGVVQRSFWLGGYQSGAETWVINSGDLTPRN